MASIVDTTSAQISITLITDGKAQFISVTPNVTSAQAGDSIIISYSIQNIGDVSDTIFVDLIDADTETKLTGDTWQLEVGAVKDWQLPTTMPNKNLNLILEAGHLE